MTDKDFRQQREVVKFTQLELVSSVENKFTSPYTFIQTRTRFDKKGVGGTFCALSHKLTSVPA